MKIEDNPSEPQMLLTVRGNLGYKIYDVHDLYYGLQDAAPNTNVLESAYKENHHYVQNNCYAHFFL